jgi:hypothetical protein
MGYYMGDFYARGGRQRFMGDPGFFSFLGGLAKKAVGFIPGAGPIISGAIDTVSGALAKHPALTSAAKSASQAIIKHPVLSAAGAASGIGAAGLALHKRGSLAGAGMGAGAAPRMRGGGGHHRRMNACNPKALRRAIRRTHSFAKLAMKTIHLVHPKKKVSFGGFKVRRKKK